MITPDQFFEIYKKYGSPVYIYDASKIRRQYKKLSHAFSLFPHQIHYAMKANENPEILKILLHSGAKIDTVSPQEIQRALQVGFKPSDIIFTPSFPDLKEIDFAIENQIKLHIGEVYVLNYIKENFSGISLGLRINPSNSIAGNQKIATAHKNSKFGIPLKNLESIKRELEGKILIDSLHIHTGSDVKNWKDLVNSVDILFSLANEFPDLKYLDLGSGFKVKYKKGDIEIDLNSYAKYIQKRLQSCQKKLKIHFEPGKYLVSESGYLLVKVNGIKEGYTKKFVGVNSGFHHLIRPMYYNAYHEIINLSNPEGKLKKYDVVGQLCEEDTFAYDREIPEISSGNLLLIKNAGAYAFSMASDYNLRPKPKEIMVDGEQIYDISQTY